MPSAPCPFCGPARDLTSPLCWLCEGRGFAPEEAVATVRMFTIGSVPWWAHLTMIRTLADLCEGRGDDDWARPLALRAYYELTVNAQLFGESPGIETERLRLLNISGGEP